MIKSMYIFASTVTLLLLVFLQGLDGKISLQERLKIQKFRNRFTKEAEQVSNNKTIYDSGWINRTSDPILFNWLEYYNFDLDETEIKLKKSLDWRRINNVDQVVNWDPTKYNFTTMFPFKLTGFTEDGDPVYYANIGRWDPRDVLRRGMRKQLFQYVVYVVERAIVHLEENNEIRRGNNQSDAGNFVMFGNVEGVTLLQVASINVLGFVANALGVLQENYPFFHRVGIAINTPGIVVNFLNVAKSVLSSRTFDRLFIYDNTQWVEHVKKVAPLSAIPEFMGGTAKI